VKSATLLAAILVLATMSLAQEGPNSVSFESAAPVSVAPGHTAQVTLVFKVGGGYHINSHKPKDELLIPTELKLEPGSFHIANQQYPAGSRFRLQVGNGEDLDVYQGEFRVALRIEAPKGDSTLSGSLRYQACDNAACFPARTLPVKIAVTAK